MPKFMFQRHVETVEAERFKAITKHTRKTSTRGGEIVICSVWYPPIDSYNFHPPLLSKSPEVGQDLFEGGVKKSNILT